MKKFVQIVWWEANCLHTAAVRSRLERSASSVENDKAVAHPYSD